MADAALLLMAVEPLPRGDWLQQAQNVLGRDGTRVEQRGTRLLAWKAIRSCGNLRYADGWSVGRIWLAPVRAALGVTSRRIYFVGAGTDIEERPEHVVLSRARRPESPMATEQLQSQWALVQRLKEGLQPSTTPVALQPLDVDLGLARVVRIGANAHVSPPAQLNDLYREHGFDVSPGGFTVSVCPLESVSEEVAEQFAKRLERAGAQRNAGMKVRTISAIAAAQRLRDLITRGETVAQGRCVLFVLPSKDQKPRVETRSLFASLSANGVPFRRAYADDPLEYSIPDQLPSLLIAAGGRPHRSPTEKSGEPIWTIGVDLGHRPESPVSVLALTLVDPDGGLVGAWTKEQPRDETARVESISVLLAHCRRRLAFYEQGSRVMVLRDGRMFENEDCHLYRDVLGTDVSLFEYRKHGNPQVACVGRACSPTENPFATLVPEASTMFVTTAPPRTERALPAVAKVTWRPEWNGLGLAPSQVASMLAAAAAAPGLGLHPRHLPAAIYWADGVAGASDHDLRFIGVPVDRIPARPS